MPISKIKSSAIDPNAITGSAIADGTVTSADLDTNIDIAGTLDVTGATTLDDTLTVGDGSGNETLTIYSGSTNEGYLRFADATSGSGAYQGRIEYDHSTGKLNIGAGGTTPFTIDSNGHFGFGTNSPANPIDATLAAGGDFVAKFQNTTSATPYNVMIKDAPSGVNGYPLLQVVDDGGTDTYFRVDSGTGNMFSNTTTVHGTNSKFSLKTDVDKSGIGITAYKSANTNYYFMNFIANTTSVGDIYSNGTSTTYATTSDYRLKENVISVSDAITRLNQLNPVRFNFISHPDMTVDGFLAHEVQNVVPEAIKGIKDEMRDEEYEITPAVLDDDNNVVVEAVMGTRSVPDYQGIDQSKLVPLLTAALQEAVAKIDALETRIAALESA